MSRNEFKSRPIKVDRMKRKKKILAKVRRRKSLPDEKTDLFAIKKGPATSPGGFRQMELDFAF